MSVDARSARASVLVAWAAFLTWLVVDGEVPRYLGTRTSWVATFGAVAIGAAACASCLAITRSSAPPLRLRASEALGLSALIVPILVALLFAHAELGTLAASRKLGERGIDRRALASLAGRGAARPSFIGLNLAGDDPDYAAKAGIAEGRPVSLTGFVLGTPRPGTGAFLLARFAITCCVADAIPIGVTVQPAAGVARRPGGGYGRDDWLAVVGVLHREHRRWTVRPVTITHVSAPKNPYLSFATG